MTQGSQTSMTIAFASCVLHTVGLQISEERIRGRLMQDNLIRSLEKSFERSLMRLSPVDQFTKEDVSYECSCRRSADVT